MFFCKSADCENNNNNNQQWKCKQIYFLNYTQLILGYRVSHSTPSQVIVSVLGLQVPEVHNVRLQSLFYDLPQNRFFVLIVLYAHPEESIVRDSKQGLSSDLVLQEEPN